MRGTDKADLSPAGDVQALFSQALVLHQNGRLSEAAALYHAILATQPNHMDALHLLGVTALQTGSPQRAVELIGQAVAINPGFAAAHNNLGAAFLACGRPGEALAALNRALALTPDYPDGLNNRGSALKSLGQPASALADFERVLALDPGRLDALLNRGQARAALGHLAEAISDFEALVRAQPGNLDAKVNLGATLLNAGRLEDAIACFDQVLVQKPDYAEAHNNRGVALHRLGQNEEAIAALERAVAAKPSYPEAYDNLGAALYAAKRTKEAIVAFDRAIALNPNHFHCYYGRATAQFDLSNWSAAQSDFEAALALNPFHADSLNNLGALLADFGKVDQALLRFEQAVDSDPNHASANFNKCLLLLLKGDFARGLPLYGWRWLATGAHKPEFGETGLWRGAEAVSGKRILLWCEQGLGDCIHFCRYAKLLSDRGAHVILQSPAPLMGLFAGLAGVSELVVHGAVAPAFDMHSPLLSLPLAFGTRVESIPWDGPYLKVDPARAVTWRDRLGAKRGVRVGLAWSGNRAHKSDHRRSIALATIMASLPMDGFDYVSLQKEVRAEDEDALAALTGSGRLRHFGDDLIDFRDTAALAAAMDVVVCVDTSVTHMCGALGLPTFVLLHYMPDWRWLLDRDDSPWYESLKLYRQGEERTWGPPLARIAQDLALLLDRAYVFDERGAK
jgi:tetratricopeptide (TPR) repeat protein